MKLIDSTFAYFGRFTNHKRRTINTSNSKTNGIPSYEIKSTYLILNSRITKKDEEEEEKRNRMQIDRYKIQNWNQNMAKIRLATKPKTAIDAATLFALPPLPSLLLVSLPLMILLLLLLLLPSSPFLPHKTKIHKLLRTQHWSCLKLQFINSNFCGYTISPIYFGVAYIF